MNPVIRHLKNIGIDLSLADEHNSLLWALGPDSYRKIMPNYAMLHLEYSVLCQQLTVNLNFINKENEAQIIEQLIASLTLAELLEHIYLYYLNIPREVRRLRQHQKIYRAKLADLKGYSLPTDVPEVDAVNVGISLSQQIRETTLNKNWYRLLLVRIKRLLDLIDTVGTGSAGFRQFVVLMDKYTNPVLPYLAWCFLLPRLMTNLILTIKHTIPGSWMTEEEQSVGWASRLAIQLQRRWFELGNDSVWVAVGVINCFLLTGVLAPVGMYVTVSFFAYDIVLGSLRACIELNRLYRLQQEYTELLVGEKNEGSRNSLLNFQKQLQKRIDFDIFRLAINVTTLTVIFLAMCFAIPAFALNPVIPLIGATCLVAVSLVSFIVSRCQEQDRPNDAIEKSSGVSSLGLFKKNKEQKSSERADNLLSPSANL